MASTARTNANIRNLTLADGVSVTEENSTATCDASRFTFQWKDGGDPHSHAQAEFPHGWLV